MSGAQCGIRLYRLLIAVFSSSLKHAGLALKRKTIKEENLTVCIIKEMRRQNIWKVMIRTD